MQDLPLEEIFRGRGREKWNKLSKFCPVFSILRSGGGLLFEFSYDYESRKISLG